MPSLRRLGHLGDTAVSSVPLASEAVMPSPYDVAKVEAFMERLRPGQADGHALIELLNGADQEASYVYSLRNHLRDMSPWERANVIYRLTEMERDTLRVMDLTWTEAARRADDAVDQTPECGPDEVMLSLEYVKSRFDHTLVGDGRISTPEQMAAFLAHVDPRLPHLTCPMCGYSGQDSGGLCPVCEKYSKEDSEKIKRLMDAGHSYHCAARHVWGDGGCEGCSGVK